MRYHTLLLDPPWPIRWNRSANGPKTDFVPDVSGFRGNPERHYPTMSLEEVAALPIPDVADADAQLWVWTINTYLHDTFHLIDQWGFDYRWTIVWDKERTGLGAWLRGQVEYLLLATRGDARWRLGAHGQEGSAFTDIIREPRREHSRKPKRAYQMIEALGIPPRIEFFARDRREGWDWYGNQLSSTIQKLL